MVCLADVGNSQHPSLPLSQKEHNYLWIKQVSHLLPETPGLQVGWLHNCTVLQLGLVPSPLALPPGVTPLACCPVKPPLPRAGNKLVSRACFSSPGTKKKEKPKALLLLFSHSLLLCLSRGHWLVWEAISLHSRQGKQRQHLLRFFARSRQKRWLPLLAVTDLRDVTPDCQTVVLALAPSCLQVLRAQGHQRLALCRLVPGCAEDAG